jgi:hypothetical protein
MCKRLWAVIAAGVQAVFASGASAQCAENWIATQTLGGFASGNAGTTTTMWDSDGNGPLQPWVVVAGSAGVPGIASDRIAAWDGVQWRALGAGFGSVVRVLHVHNGDLYAGGDFSTSGGIQFVARWNGTTWVPLGTNAQNGASNSVYAMTSYNGNLVIGGYFTQVGGNISANRVASWNGATWSAVGNGVSGGVESLTVLGTDLIAAGVFTTLSPSGAALRIARFNGATWSALGDGFTSQVQVVHVHAGELYAGGSFGQSGTTPISCIARWTGSAWQQVGAGFNSTVNSLTTYNGNLVAGGNMSSSGAIAINRIAQFVAGAWSTVGAGVSSNVADMVVTPNNELVLVGAFTDAGGLECQGIARFNGINYTGFGNALSGGVNALTLFNGDVVATGRFRSNGSVAVNRVARLVNGQWQPMGAGFGREGNALIVFNNQLFIGGTFFVGDCQLRRGLERLIMDAHARTERRGQCVRRV